jgi:hypothetical protein
VSIRELIKLFWLCLRNNEYITPILIDKIEQLTKIGTYVSREASDKRGWEYGDCFLKFGLSIIITYTYTPLALYPRRGSRGISYIPPRRPRFTIIP